MQIGRLASRLQLSAQDPLFQASIVAGMVQLRSKRPLETGVVFAKRLRDRVISGEITCSVRIWRWPHVKVGGRYGLGAGAIEVTAIREISLQDITPELARRSGFEGVVDLLKVAKHGRGENIYLIDFEYHEEGAA